MSCSNRLETNVQTHRHEKKLVARQLVRGLVHMSLVAAVPPMICAVILVIIGERLVASPAESSYAARVVEPYFVSIVVSDSPITSPALAS